jgi:hypothetical protein
MGITFVRSILVRLGMSFVGQFAKKSLEVQTVMKPKKRSE